VLLSGNGLGNIINWKAFLELLIVILTGFNLLAAPKLWQRLSLFHAGLLALDQLVGVNDGSDLLEQRPPFSGALGSKVAPLPE
jgi:hypothetical protein